MQLLYVRAVLCALFSLFRLRFFFNDTAPTEIYTLSLHDALPICQLHTRADERAARRGVPAAAVGRAGAGGRLATAGRDGRLGAPVCGVVGREDQCTSLSYGAIR